MSDVRGALLRAYRAGKTALKFHEVLEENGLGDSAFYDVYGDIADSIYYLTGDGSASFNESLTWKVLHSDDITEENAVGMLIDKFNANSQPRPNTIEPDEMKKMAAKNGGYMHETPEGDWTDKPDYEAMYKKAMRELKSCGNELCYRCGNYSNEHLGACNGCRWRYVKSGEMPT